MASILDEYEDSQNTRQSAQQHSRLSTANIGITHSGRSPSSSGEADQLHARMLRLL